MRLTPGRFVSACALAVALLPAFAVDPGGAAAASGGIHPGGHVSFGGVTCTIGAVMHEGSRLFLAIPASCGGIDPGKIQDGCAEAESPVGLPVSIAGAHHPGKLVYNSFTEMQLLGITSPAKCYYNDLALVRIDKRDASRVSGAIPGMHSPQRVASARPAAGAPLKVNGAAATAGATHHHGWEHDFTTLAMLGTSAVGSPVVAGNFLLGMLTVLPSGTVIKAPAETYSLAMAMKFLHNVAGYRHVALLRR